VSGYRIVCVSREGITPHRHVSAAGLETASLRWSAAQIRRSMAAGERFSMRSQSTGGTVEVRPYDCDCGAQTLRSFTSSPIYPELDELEEYVACPPLEPVGRP
jgi:hypothetical protein